MGHVVARQECTGLAASHDERDEGGSQPVRTPAIEPHRTPYKTSRTPTKEPQ